MWCITCGARRVCGSCLAKLVSNGACLCQRRVRSQRHVRGTCGHWTSSSIATTRAKPFKICNVIDEFTREHVGFEVARSITPIAVIDLLENVAAVRGRPGGVCVWITPPEFISRELAYRAAKHDTVEAFIPPGMLWHNGFVESFHNRLRDEL